MPHRSLARGPRRLLSLDAFRGLAITGMILVSCPGNDRGYAWLKHADWHGWTAGDMLFPAFLFAMGVSVALSLGRRRDRGLPVGRLLRQSLRRGAAILALGLLGSAALALGDSPLRIPGVLQRIALCYAATCLLFLKTAPLTQGLCAGAILLGYWLLLAWVPAPGFWPGDLSPEGNIASYLDRLLMGKHLFRPTDDPDGLLSTFPALTSALAGALAGQWLRSSRRLPEKATGLLRAGVLAVTASLVWGLAFPINKSLWTSSFALLSTGLSLLVFAFCYWLCEIQGLRAWARPLEVFGKNALLSYFLSQMGYSLQEFLPAGLPDGSPGDLKLWLCSALFGWLRPPDAALAYAMSYTLLCLGLMAIFYRKRVFLKI